MSVPQSHLRIPLISAKGCWRQSRAHPPYSSHPYSSLAPKENVQEGDAEPHGQDTQGLNELVLNKCQSGSGAALGHFAFSLNI